MTRWNFRCCFIFLLLLLRIIAFEVCIMYSVETVICKETCCCEMQGLQIVNWREEPIILYFSHCLLNCFVDFFACHFFILVESLMLLSLCIDDRKCDWILFIKALVLRRWQTATFHRSSSHKIHILAMTCYGTVLGNHEKHGATYVLFLSLPSSLNCFLYVYVLRVHSVDVQ